MNYLKYKGYFGTVEFNTADKVLYGKVIGINDLVNYESTNVKDIEKEFQAAVDDYLETCKALKKDPDKAYSGTFNVRIKPELHKDVVRLAEINHVNLNELVGYAVAYIVRHEDEIIISSNEIKNTLETWTIPGMKTVTKGVSWANRNPLGERGTKGAVIKAASRKR